MSTLGKYTQTSHHNFHLHLRTHRRTSKATTQKQEQLAATIKDSTQNPAKAAKQKCYYRAHKQQSSSCPTCSLRADTLRLQTWRKGIHQTITHQY